MSALTNPNSSLSGRIHSEAISSANYEMSGLVRQDTGQNSKTISTPQGRYVSFSAKNAFL